MKENSRAGLSQAITGFDSFLLFELSWEKGFTMNVSLTPELKKFVRKEVGTGLYQTASEVVRAGLRRLKEDKKPHPRELPRTLRELEADLLKSAASLDRGEGVDGEIVFQRLRKKMKARLRG